MKTVFKDFVSVIGKIYKEEISSKLFSKEIATQLGGRALSYILLPFNFREFLKLRGFNPGKYMLLEEEAKIRRYLRVSMDFGSFPEVVLKKDKKDKERILREYFNTILYNDFVERFGLNIQS